MAEFPAELYGAKLSFLPILKILERNPENNDEEGESCCLLLEVEGGRSVNPNPGESCAIALFAFNFVTRDGIAGNQDKDDAPNP